MDSSAFNVLSLFTGVGGLDLGLKLAVPTARVVCCVEREAFACEILATRMQQGCLDDAPIWTDVVTFAGSPWRGVVDCIAGGFPCQDISNAGKRAGIQGQRSGLWYEMARIIGEVRPRFVFLENVQALLVRGIDAVCGSLAELGFDAEWCCLPASAVGASHQRKRVFLLAYRESTERGKIGNAGASREGREMVADPERNGRRQGAEHLQPGGGESESAGARKTLEDAPRLRPHGRKRKGSGGGRGVRQAGSSMGDTERNGEPRPSRLAVPGRDKPADRNVGDSESRGRLQAISGQAEGLGPFPPGPGDLDQWARTLADHPHLAPAIEPGVRVLADGLAYVVDEFRVDQLRAGGNGVVALQAAAAFRVLWNRLME